MEERQYDHRNTYVIRLVIGAVALAVFLFMYYLYVSGKGASFDREAGALIRDLRTPLMNTVLTHITFMGKWTTIVTIGVVLLIIDAVKWHKPDYPLAIGACLLNLGLYAILKRTIQRSRPDEAFWIIAEEGFSLPSGHSMNGMFCYGMMLYVLYRNCDSRPVKAIMTVLLCTLILLIGFSRPYLGVHYPTDVIAGLSMGLAMLMLFTVLIDEILLRLHQD